MWRRRPWKSRMSSRPSMSVRTGVSIFGIGINVMGQVDVDAAIRIGYDTFGLRELLRQLTGGPAPSPGQIGQDILDGLYFDASRTNGTTATHFKLSGDIGVGA